MLHAGDGMSHAREEDQEAERKRQEEESRLRDFRERAVQRTAQIAQELAAVDQERRDLHKREQADRPRCYDDFGDEPYCEQSEVQRELVQASYQARKLGIEGALMATGLFYSDREYKGMAKGQRLPEGVYLGSDVTSARGESPIVTKREYDQRIQQIDFSKHVWPTGVYTDDAMSALANQGVVVDTSNLRCADLQCVDSYGRCICQGHNLGGTSRVLKVDREDERKAQMFVNDLIRLSRKEFAFGRDDTNGVRQKSLPRGKVDRDGNSVEY